MTAPNTVRTIVPRPEFRREVEAHCGQLVSTCFQCEKCSSGCPVAFAMDILPHRLIRAVHLGLKDEVLKSDLRATLVILAMEKLVKGFERNKGNIYAHLVNAIYKVLDKDVKEVK